jgi:type IV pilus assembly protein PilV
MTRSVPQTPRQHRGFTLIESLVALVVLSIGLLGVAALQLASLQANYGSSQRTQATFLAQDIVDRMRVNRDAAIAGAYDIDFGQAAPTTPANVAEADLARWKARLLATLPASHNGSAGGMPDGEIASDPASETLTIRIRWDDSRGRELPLELGMTVRL